MTFRVRFTEEAIEDLARLHAFSLQQAAGNWRSADDALEAIRHGLALLETSPFACRRAAGGSALLRELLVGFGSAGYVALFEVENAGTVTVLAVRHQREDDYR